MLKNIKMSNQLESFLKGLNDGDRFVKDMTTDQFSKFLTNKGYTYPTHAKPGSRYLNVFGAAEKVKTKKPFGLIIYEPREKRQEQYFAEPEEALGNAPDGGLWQVLNLWTMKVIYDPFNTGKGAKQDA